LAAAPAPGHRCAKRRWSRQTVAGHVDDAELGRSDLAISAALPERPHELRAPFRDALSRRLRSARRYVGSPFIGWFIYRFTNNPEGSVNWKLILQLSLFGFVLGVFALVASKLMKSRTPPLVTAS
jgi:hypothetical protein